MKTNQSIKTTLLLGFVITGLFAYSTYANQKGKMLNLRKSFFKAITDGDISKVKILLKKDSSLASAVDEQGVSALLQSLYHNQAAVADLLLATGIKLNIFEASATGQTARVKALLQQDKALLNAYSSDGFYPLGLAIFFGHQDAAETLLQAGADVNQVAKNAIKVAPLHAAAASKHFELAKRLLELGANANARQQGGFTPLHEVAANGQIEFAKLLLAHGADVNAKTDSGKTPLAFAIAAGQTEMTNLLREHGGVK
ncbi:MAG: ankyrin repeat domain-containing protein [Acidobacteria bacterium]|nr:ankyrin repeat domain-containing protein [Acidobacteriota bacterium]